MGKYSMANQVTADKTDEAAENSPSKNYGYDNWYWLMDQPLEHNLNAANSSQEKS